MSGSDIEVGNVKIEQAAYFGEIVVGPGDLDGDGVFVLSGDDGTKRPWIRLQSGTVLHGISVRDGGVDATGQSAGLFLIVHCTDGTAFLVNDSPALSDPDDKFLVEGGSTGVVYLDRRAIQLLYDGTNGCWITPDWNGTQQTIYTSDGVASEPIGTWSVGLNQVVSVTAFVTVGYIDGVVPRAQTWMVHGHGRRAAGSASAQGTSGLNDGGNVAGPVFTWSAPSDVLTLAFKTTYVGDVTVQVDYKVRVMTIT